jgi:hypothetical protein
MTDRSSVEKRRARSHVEWLRSRGFDQSKYSPRSGTWLVWCSQCEAAVICGVPCHETGCPNKVVEAREED